MNGSSFIDTSGSLKAQVAKGAVWLYSLQGTQKAMTIVQMIILARLLSPKDFGLIGIATIAMGTLEVFSITGFSKALVQRQDINNDFLNTAWTVAIIRGIVLFLILFFAAPLISGFFSVPESLPIIQVLALSFLLKGLRNIGVIYFSKKLEFHKTFIWQLSAFVAGFTVTIWLAIVLRDKWAIVWGMMATQIVSAFGSYIVSGYRPRVHLNLQIAKGLFVYGKWILWSNILVFLSRQGDKLFLTKFFGVVPLGTYTMATKFAEQPTVVNMVVQKILFPAYSSIQDNIERMRRIYLKVLSFVALCAVPVMVGMMLLAKPFVFTVLGEKWSAAVVPMQILSIGILVKSITGSSASLFNAYGKPSANFYMTLVQVCVLFISVIPLAAKFGINGVALSFTLSCTGGIAVWLIALNRYLNIKPIEIMKVLLAPVCLTLVVVLVVGCIIPYMLLDELLQFMAVVLLAVSLYMAMVFAIHKLTRIKVLRY